MVLSLGVAIPSHAQQTDPTLTAAVLAQTAELKNIHKQRKKTQEKIIAAETAGRSPLTEYIVWRTSCLNTSPTHKVRCRTSIKSNVQGNWY